MRQALFFVLIISASSHAALAENGGTREKARPIETRNAEDGRAIPVPAAVEKLPVSATSKAVSSCPTSNRMTPAAARDLVLKIAQEESFYPEFVVAVAHAESQFDVNAASPRGAIGLMQLEPATAERYRVRICDPADNVRGGIRFLRKLHVRYKNPLFILAAYNAGEETLRQYRGVPPFPETVRFVASVLNEFYDWPAAGAAHSRAAPSGRATRAGPSPGQPSPESDANEDRWKSGFVWNVE